MTVTINGTTGIVAPAFDGTVDAADLTGSLPALNGSALTNLSAGNLTGNVPTAQITTALNASGSAPIYACRAWVNFNGTGTVAIRASGNVSSITDGGVGIYTVNFTTAMPDANYAANISLERDTTGTANVRTCAGWPGGRTASSFQLVTEYSAGSGAFVDMPAVYVAIFR